MMPGADFFIVLRTSIYKGLKSALAADLGIVAGTIVWLLVGYFFIAFLQGAVLASIKLLGGSYLLYMAASILYSLFIKLREGKFIGGDEGLLAKSDSKVALDTTTQNTNFYSIESNLDTTANANSHSIIESNAATQDINFDSTLNSTTTQNADFDSTIERDLNDNSVNANSHSIVERSLNTKAANASFDSTTKIDAAKATANSKNASLKGSFLKGALTNLSNPKAPIFVASILAYLPDRTPASISLALLFVMLLIPTLWFFLVAAALRIRASLFLKYASFIDVIAVLVFGGFGAELISSGLRALV